MEKGKVIVVDDEPHQRIIMSEAVKAMGYEVAVAETPMKALEQIRFGNFDVLITDMQMPEMTGIRLLENVQVHDPTVSVIVVTAHGTIETAVEAMKKGAEDYLTKPVEFGALDVALERLFKKRALVTQNRLLQTENEALKQEMKVKFRVSNTIGKSPKTLTLVAEIEKQMKLKTPLLILGEPGCGRSDIARMIHYNGPWASQALMSFDCGSVPEELHEKQLFGEELKLEGGVKTPSRPGLVERAHQGTLVISNIHKMAKICQPNLSRVLREQKTQRSGGSKFYPVNLRVVATSRKHEFEEIMNQTQLRWDIHELLKENSITVPPVRERADDIPLMIAAIAKRFSLGLGKNIEKIDRSVIECLSKYDFPGNNDELSAIVESAVVRCNDTVLKPEHFVFPQMK